MFQSFYQLREQPFGVNPDPRFLYLSRTHREAFSSLLYRIQVDSGFLAMIAQPGMGKTTLLFHLLRRLQGTAKTAFIFQTQCTSNEFLRHLLSEFDCDTSITDNVGMSRALKSLLLAEANAGRRCVLVVDEAQDLGPEVLETIRLLSNFETPRRKLLNIVLSGQSELGEMLSGAGLQQLRQRLSCIAYLQKFTPGETALYIAHRLAIAGYPGKVSGLFSLQALKRIAQLSEGVPRVINNLCFNALSLGYALEARQIDLGIIEEVAGDLGLSSRSRFTAAAPAESSPAAAPSDLLDGYRESDIDALSDVSATFAKREVETAASIAAEIHPQASEAAAQSECVGEGDGLASVSCPVCASPSKALKEALSSDGEVSPRSEPSANSLPAAESDQKNQTTNARLQVNDRPARRKTAGLYLVRGFFCVLVLCIAPAIDLPAPHSVAARSVRSDSVPTGTARTTEVPAPAHPNHAAVRPDTKARRLDSPEMPHWAVSRNSTAGRRRRMSFRSSVPVDLALATFAPEPLIEPLPIRPFEPLTHEPPAQSHADYYQRASRGWPAPTAADPAIQRRRSVPAYVPPKVLWQPAPTYGYIAQRIAQRPSPTGDVQLVVSVSSRGDVYRVGVLKGRADLAYAAANAAEKWKYIPALSNGHPVDSQVYVTIQFR